jgi:hypothetical protein
MSEQLEQLSSVPAFSESQSFEHAQRVAKMLSSSSLIPKEYQGNIQNTMIALEISNRTGASPLMVMQNLYIVHGKPSWSSTFIVASINSCGKFSPLRYDMQGTGKDLSCLAWAYDKATGDKLEGVRITMAMAEAEGWINKAGSKWKTMPELMIRYRAAAFFGRLYAPEIMMGMHTVEEIEDISGKPVVEQVDAETKRLNALVDNTKKMIEKCKTEDDLNQLLGDAEEYGLLTELEERRKAITGKLM